MECPKCKSVDGVAGVQIRGVYDGVLFQNCLECGTSWHCWPEGHPLRARAEAQIHAWTH